MSNGYYMISKIALGARVKITSAGKKYQRFNLLGKIGIVRSNYGTNLAVEFDDLKNPASGPGYFYLSEYRLTIVDDDDYNDLEDNKMINITGYQNAIKIKFIGESHACGHVYASFESDLKVGDLVVVKPAHHSINLARVEEILDGTSYETMREVVSKVDTEAYNQRVKIRNQAAELKAQMEARAKKLQDIALYQMLAENDSEMKELVAQYQALTQA